MAKIRLFAIFAIACILSSAALAQYGGPRAGERAADAVNERLLAIVEMLRQISAPLALVLVVFAGLVYAVCQPLDKETRARGQRWSISMVIGTAVGILIIAGAPSVVGFLVGMGG